MLHNWHIFFKKIIYFDQTILDLNRYQIRSINIAHVCDSSIALVSSFFFCCLESYYWTQGMNHWTRKGLTVVNILHMRTKDLTQQNKLTMSISKMADLVWCLRWFMNRNRGNWISKSKTLNNNNERYIFNRYGKIESEFLPHQALTHLTFGEITVIVQLFGIKPPSQSNQMIPYGCFWPEKKERFFLPVFITNFVKSNLNEARNIEINN